MSQRQSYMPTEEQFKERLKRRHLWGNLWRAFYYFSIFVAIAALLSLFFNVTREAFGSIAVQVEVDPATLTEDGRPLSEVDVEGFEQILLENMSSFSVLVRSNVSVVSDEVWRERPLVRDFMGDQNYPQVEQLPGWVSEYDQTPNDGTTSLIDVPVEDLGDILLEQAPERLPDFVRERFSAVSDERWDENPPVNEAIDGAFPFEWFDLTLDELSNEQWLQLLTDNLSRDELHGLIATEIIGDWSNLDFRQLTAEQQVKLLTLNLSRNELQDLVEEEIVGEEVVESWPLPEAIFNFEAIQAEAAEEYPDATLIRYYSWLNADFLNSYMNSVPAEAGIRSAILGSIYLMVIVVSFSLPVGVGTAIYLQEYANRNLINRIIETNIRNLAGVPSIIYGMLGLAVLVRTFEQFFDTGRIILAGGLTLSLLILPIIIINAQEALRSVPNTIREASYGLGATKWQTIWRTVLPTALPGILTGTIIAVSRAVGETAPLIVVGATHFATFDPTLTSRFTALPIQIYNWTARPQDQFKDAAAAAIIVLLVLMLTLNAIAIILRNRYSRRF